MALGKWLAVACIIAGFVLGALSDTWWIGGPIQWFIASIAISLAIGTLTIPVRWGRKTA